MPVLTKPKYRTVPISMHNQVGDIVRLHDGYYEVVIAGTIEAKVKSLVTGVSKWITVI